MTVMALALAYEREGECDALEGHAVYDSVGEVVGWLGLANDMRLELAECCGELGIEVES